MRVSAFMKKSLIKYGICGVENDISLYIAYKAVSIILIPNKYHQFRIWYKFVSINFNRKKYIGSTAKDTEVQYFGFISQEGLLKYSPLEMSNRHMIVYMSCSCYENSHQ